MGWKEDVADIVERLPARFSLRDVYRFAPELHHKHPENRHIKDKIRQQLQVLRDENHIQFLGKEGQYLRTGPTILEPEVSFHLEPGTITTREDLAKLLGYGGKAGLARGMVKPQRGPLQDHIFLFHAERENPYGDVDEGDRIYYIGQGQKGDQTMTAQNLYLAEHLERGYTVHYFVQPASQPGKIRYEGEVAVQAFDRLVRPGEDRSVIRYTLIPLSRGKQNLVLEYGNEVAEILEYGRSPGPVERERKMTMAERVARDRAFRNIILGIYGRQCAICGTPLQRDKAIELQGAHIMGVSENGPDELRNGISLCVRHHWAFDNGIFSLTDNHKIIWFSPDPDPDPHSEIEPGERIHLPESEIDCPHPEYLSFHRRKWQIA